MMGRGYIGPADNVKHYGGIQAVTSYMYLCLTQGWCMGDKGCLFEQQSRVVL